MKLLFVCTGNTCRSPMLENMFSKYLQDNGIKDIQVCSAGIIADGAPMNDYCSSVLTKHKIPHKKQTSKNVDEQTLLACDIVFTMTQEHADFIKRKFGKGKVYSLSTLFDVDIFDPYGKDEKAYEQTYRIFDNLLKSILDFVNSTLQVAI